MSASVHGDLKEGRTGLCEKSKAVFGIFIAKLCLTEIG